MKLHLAKEKLWFDVNQKSYFKQLFFQYEYKLFPGESNVGSQTVVSGPAA